MTQTIAATTTATFRDDVSTAGRPVLVDFYADWCAPCKAVQPIVENFVAGLGEQMAAVKVDVDQEPELAARFGIRSIPTLLLFKDGKPVETIIGLTSKENLSSVISSHL